MEQMQLDAIDLQLLTQLQTDASLSNQALAERVHTSPPTCLRRVKRLRDAGLIERQIAVLNPERLAATLGHGLTAIVEITLDRQDAQSLDQFEAKVAHIAQVQQCYRVSPGPDFCLVVHAAHMPDYQALAQRLFTSDANVRNVKAFFSVKRSKFGAELPLSAAT
jgi:Lrp/AsnC family leucine-responsive transcriptional regulator